MEKQQFKKLQIGDLVKRIETEPQYAERIRLGVVTRIFNNASRTINTTMILWNYEGDTYISQYTSGDTLSLGRIELLSKAKKI